MSESRHVAVPPKGRGVYALVAMPSVHRADAFRSVIAELGHPVVVVRDGQEACTCLTDRGAPLLLVADLSLPKLDAFALLKQLRRDPAGDDTAVIVVSAYEQLRAAARTMADSLKIARILPADPDRAAILDAVSQSTRSTHAPPPPAPVTDPRDRHTVVGSSRHPISTRELLGAALLEASRRFSAQICLGYVRLGDIEHFGMHLTSSETPPPGPRQDEWLLARQLATAGEPLVLVDLQAHPLAGESLGLTSSPFRGFAGIPLFREHAGASGALCLADSEPGTLSATDIDSLEVLGAELERQIEASVGSLRQSSVPIATAIDVDTLERLAVTDPLTGLANRRGGERSVTSEISRARRQKSPLSCIFIDIDNFKRINDTFGHQAGDRLLRDLSELFRRTLRAYDILVRWGGEEFLLILPGVTLDQARKLAERIRSAVERLETEDLGTVTISAGTAALDATYDFETMLMTADRRLYQAKASGRNAVV